MFFGIIFFPINYLALCEMLFFSVQNNYNYLFFSFKPFYLHLLLCNYLSIFIVFFYDFQLHIDFCNHKVVVVVVVDPTPPTCCQQSPVSESCGSQQSLPPGGTERLHFVGIRPEVQARKGGW